MIFSLAEQGLGNIAIASELRFRQIVAPSVYKFQRGDEKFARYPAVKDGDSYGWSYGTIGQILNNRVYTGELISLKTEIASYKTKKHTPVPPERQIVTPNAHEAIISEAQYQNVQNVRSGHYCPGNGKRFNLFRDKLFCECCGHPLTISKK